MEEEEIEVIVFLGEKVSKDPCRVSTADLVRRQREVDALHEIPELCHRIVTEHPEKIKPTCKKP